MYDYLNSLVIEHSLYEIYELENKKPVFCGIPLKNILNIQVLELQKKNARCLYKQIKVLIEESKKMYRNGLKNFELFIFFIEDEIGFSDDQWSLFLGKRIGVKVSFFIILKLEQAPIALFVFSIFK